MSAGDKSPRTSVFSSDLEWLPAIAVLSAPTVSLLFLTGLEGHGDQGITIAFSLLTTATVFAILYSIWFVVRRLASGNRGAPSRVRLLRESLCVFAILQSLIALVFLFAASGADTYGSRQRGQVQAVVSASMVAFVLLLATGVVGLARERTVYGKPN